MARAGPVDDDVSSDSDSSIEEDSEGWDDVEDDTEEVQIKDFFSDETFASATSMLKNCKERHGLDFVALTSRLGVCLPTRR